MDVRFSITIRQRASLRDLIEAIPEEDWTPIPYWMDGAADVAETTYTPFQTKPDAAPVRLIVRRVKPTPGSQLALFARYSYHAFITDRDGETLELEADHRRHAEVENAIRDLKYGVGLNHMPSARFAANGAWLAVQVMAHNLDRWTARIGLGERTVITKTSGGGSSLWWDGSPARRAASLCISPGAGLGKPSSVAPWPGCKPFRSRPDGQPATDPTSPAISRHPGRESPLLRILSPSRASQLPHRALGPCAATEDRPPASHIPQDPRPSPCSSLTHPLPLSSRRPSVSFGGFGLRQRDLRRHRGGARASDSDLCRGSGDGGLRRPAAAQIPRAVVVPLRSTAGEGTPPQIPRRGDLCRNDR